MESMPTVGYSRRLRARQPTALYASKHNEFVLFDDIRNDPSRLANVKQYTSFATDLQRERTTPDFVWIVAERVPRHARRRATSRSRPTAPTGRRARTARRRTTPNDAALKQKADAFVKTAVTTIMHSPAWHDGKSAIFIVTDENDFTGNTTTGGWESADGCCDSPVLIAGDPSVSASWPGGTYGGGLHPGRDRHETAAGKTGGYVSSVLYNHYSLLATVEQNWNLGYLGNASDANAGDCDGRVLLALAQQVAPGRSFGPGALLSGGRSGARPAASRARRRRR